MYKVKFLELLYDSDNPRIYKLVNFFLSPQEKEIWEEVILINILVRQMEDLQYVFLKLHNVTSSWSWSYCSISQWRFFVLLKVLSFVKTKELFSTILKVFTVKDFYLLMIVPVQSFSLNKWFCKKLFSDK